MEKPAAEGMKRAGNLWPGLVSWPNLLAAAEAAARGKRKRSDVARFLLDLETNVCELARELEDGCYTARPYRTFWIKDPKPRLISAACFRDRVVHQAVTQTIEPVFEPRFTTQSFASRRGYGQHRALELARAGCARFPYVLKCDIRKYFPSIDHEILKGLLRRAMKCGRTLELCDRIIDGSNAQEESLSYFPGDDLFTPYERRRGLPIGNQTSQFFGNVYLNSLDHFILRQLRPALYLRYVDDFVLFAEGKAALREMRASIVQHLCGLRLRLNEGKSRVYRTTDGVRFLGWRLFPKHARLPRTAVVRMRRRLAAIAARYHEGEIGFEEVRSRVHAWLGHAAFGSTFGLRQHLFEQFKLVAAERGRNSAGRFLEQQSKEHPGIEP